MAQDIFAEMEEYRKQLNIKEYRLMYIFGGWVTREVICAQDDNEAIFDSDESFRNSRLHNWPHGVALFQNGRMVKRYR